MRINNQNKLYINNSKTTKQPKTPAFKGLLYIDPKTKMPLDSWFYRDYATLEAANYEIEKTFPNGAEIWDFACANAEETISEKTLLENPKYKLIGYDSSTSAIKLAKKGIYTVFSNWYDSFLLPDNTQDSKELYLKDKFYNIMEEIEPPETERHINNKADYFNIKKFYHSFQEKYFQVKPQRRKEIDIRTGNINRIENYRNNDKIGAVFFRNALYQMTGNDINETIDLPLKEMPKGKENLNAAGLNVVKSVEDGLDVYRISNDKGHTIVVGRDDRAQTDLPIDTYKQGKFMPEITVKDPSLDGKSIKMLAGSRIKGEGFDLKMVGDYQPTPNGDKKNVSFKGRTVITTLNKEPRTLNAVDSYMKSGLQSEAVKGDYADVVQADDPTIIIPAGGFGERFKNMSVLFLHYNKSPIHSLEIPI